jgi:two-component sensor histidine kinase
VSAIWIGDAAGNAVLTSNVHPSPQLNASNRDYVRFVMENPTRLSINYVARSLYANTPQIKITRRIGAPDAPYRGFITVDVSQEQFRALYQRLRIGSGVVIWLLDPGGQPLSRDPPGTPAQFTTPDWIPAMLQGAPEGIVTTASPITGEETLYVFRRSPTYGPVSLITAPTRAVLKPWRERLWIYLALAAAALAAIAVIGAATLGWLTRHQERSDELERRVQERTHELKDLLKQKDVLVAELNHRVKNTLATVQSIARQTLRTSPDLKAFGRSFDDRLLALSSTYALLTDADWTAASLQDLLKAELAPYLQDDGSRVRLEGPFIQLSPGLALSTGLVVHELTTNAAKYGALSTPTGRVEVTWTVQDRSDGWLLKLAWSETGGPTVGPPSRVGFGTRLMTTSFERVGGAVRFDYAPEGLRCFIEVPIPPPLPTSPVAIETRQEQAA